MKRACLPALLVGLLFAAQPDRLVARVAQDPEIVTSRLLVRGMTRAFLGDHEGALELFQQALQLHPEDPTLHAAVAGTLVRMGDMDRASFFAERAVSLAPDRPENVALVAELRQLTGDAIGSLEAYDALIELLPADVAPRIARARLMKSLEQRSDALAAFADARSVAPLPLDVLEEYLDVQMSLGELDGALETLDEMNALESTAGTHIERGRIFVRTDRAAEAIQAFSHALELDPTNQEATRALAALNPELAAELAVSEDPADRAGRLVREAEENLRNVNLRIQAIDATLQVRAMTDALRLVEDGLLFFPGNSALVERAVDAYLLALRPDDIADVLRSIDADSPIRAPAEAAATWLRTGEASATPGDLVGRLAVWGALAGNASEIDITAEIPSSAVARALQLSRNAGPETAAAILERSDTTRAPLEWLVLGDLRAAAGRRGEAVEAWQVALDMAPSNPIALSRLR